MDLVGDVLTERLEGRRPREEDHDDYLRIWTDPRVAEEVWPASLRTPADVERVLRTAIQHWDRWGFGPWTAVERDTGAVVGRIGLGHTLIDGHPEIEAMWFVDADRWGRGYATELGREAVRAAFADLELESVVAFTTHPNAASQAVMRHLGMTYERDIVHVGLPHVLYRLTAAEHARLR